VSPVLAPQFVTSIGLLLSDIYVSQRLGGCFRLCTDGLPVGPLLGCCLFSSATGSAVVGTLRDAAYPTLVDWKTCYGASAARRSGAFLLCQLWTLDALHSESVHLGSSATHSSKQVLLCRRLPPSSFRGGGLCRQVGYPVCALFPAQLPHLFSPSSLPLSFKDFLRCS
jgi:hypothetical protein